MNGKDDRWMDGTLLQSVSASWGNGRIIIEKKLFQRKNIFSQLWGMLHFLYAQLSSKEIMAGEGTTVNGCPNASDNTI